MPEPAADGGTGAGGAGGGAGAGVADDASEEPGLVAVAGDVEPAAAVSGAEAAEVEDADVVVLPAAGGDGGVGLPTRIQASSPAMSRTPATSATFVHDRVGVADVAAGMAAEAAVRDGDFSVEGSADADGGDVRISAGIGAVPAGVESRVATGTVLGTVVATSSGGTVAASGISSGRLASPRRSASRNAAAL